MLRFIRKVLPSASQTRNTLIFPRYLSTQHEKTWLDIEKLSQGKGVQIKWSSGRVSRFHSSWLRMNCACKLCKQSNSGQRTIDTTKLTKNITVTDFSCLGDKLTVTWQDDEDHSSTYSLNWLQQHSYMKEDIEQQSLKRKFHPFKGVVPESSSYEDVANSTSGHLKFLRHINENGLALVKNVPVDDESYSRIVERTGPIQTTIYGKFFDVISTPNPINIAYSSAQLDYHMDLAYYQSPPGIQFLHCRRFDKQVAGGESILLDIYAVAEQFRQTNPDEFDTLVRVPATFQKIHFERDAPVYMKYQRPHIALNHRHEIVSITWSPPFEGPLLVEEHEVEPYYDAYFAFAKAIDNSHLQVSFKLEVGDVIAFNNIRMLHGRSKFELNGGVRSLRGCYVNIDEFRNKVDVISHLHGDKKLSKRVGNNCFF